MDAFFANGDRYNLLNSAVLEMVEFIRKENLKVGRSIQGRREASGGSDTDLLVCAVARLMHGGREGVLPGGCCTCPAPDSEARLWSADLCGCLSVLGVVCCRLLLHCAAAHDRTRG